MPTSGRGRRVATEFVGSCLLTGTVIGSGIMATGLTRDSALALLLNDIATVLVLILLIWALGPISGAHFNPIVTLVLRRRSNLDASTVAGYAAAQIVGAVAGAALANVMYGKAAISISGTERGGAGQWVAEVVATAGLIAIICIALDRSLSRLIPLLVPAWIGAAYLFTSSTSFANPAVTIGRIFSDSFAGISPASVLPFVLTQAAGGALGWIISRALLPDSAGIR